MESTKIFNKLSFKLKKKIYERYSLNFEEIKPLIKEAVINIYGKNYSNLIEKKLNQIHLINFFEEIDLSNYFYNSTDKFIPKVLSSDEIDSKSDIEVSLEKLDGLFGGTSYKIEKKYDIDVIDYDKLCYEYYNNLYDEYSISYTNKISANNVYKKRNAEYNLNTSMYSFFKETLSKLNLLIDSDFLYKNLKDNLSLHNSYLINNINRNFEKTDIIIVNPIKFSANDVFSIVNTIISSINTDLSIDENKSFIFNRGINDIFIKHNFNQGIEYDNRNYRLLTDFINEVLTFEVINYLEKHNISIWGYTSFPTLTSYPKSSSAFSLFYNSYKSFILDSIITKNTEILFNQIGEKNFIDFIETNFKYMEERKNAYFNNRSYIPEDNPLLNSLFKKREELLAAMKSYNNPN